MPSQPFHCLVREPFESRARTYGTRALRKIDVSEESVAG